MREPTTHRIPTKNWEPLRDTLPPPICAMHAGTIAVRSTILTRAISVEETAVRSIVPTVAICVAAIAARSTTRICAISAVAIAARSTTRICAISAVAIVARSTTATCVTTAAAIAEALAKTLRAVEYALEWTPPARSGVREHVFPNPSRRVLWPFRG